MFTGNLPRLPLVFWVLVCASSVLVAQDALFPTLDFRSRALGGTGLTATGVEAVWTNPAGLAATRSMSATATTEQRFGLSELSIHSAGVAFPGGVGLQLASFTYAGLAEQRLGLAYGRRLSDRVGLGVELTGLFLQTPNQAAEFLVVPGIGLNGRLSDRVSVGLRVAGTPARARAGRQIALGGSYRPSDQLLLTGEVQHASAWPVRFCAGLEYVVRERFVLRGGGASGPAQLSFGSAFRVAERLEVGLTAAFHRVLGVTPLVGFTFHPGGRE